MNTDTVETTEIMKKEALRTLVKLRIIQPHIIADQVVVEHYYAPLKF